MATRNTDDCENSTQAMYVVTKRGLLLVAAAAVLLEGMVRASKMIAVHI